MTVFIHPSAVVDEGAVIGQHTKIWHFCHVMGKARIGAQCSLGQNVFVADHVVMGNHCKIQNNVSLYEGLILEDYVFCGPSMVFTNVKVPRAAYPRANSTYTQTLIKRSSTIGANATIVCGVTLGECAFIAAGAVVTKDVPAYAQITGVPGRITGWRGETGDLLKFDEQGRARDSAGFCYELLNGEKVRLISASEPGSR